MSNLPPGVTEGMIPGNTPEDAAWEELFDKITIDATDDGMDARDARIAWIIGWKAFHRARKHFNDVFLPELKMQSEEIADLRARLESEGLMP